MSNYVFNDAERYAVYTVHGEKCYMCGEPIDLLSMEVDHIIPEQLLRDPERLAAVLVEYGLLNDFNLNSYANWLPACKRCNNRKRAKVFDATPRIQLELQIAAEKAPRASDLAQDRRSRQAISRAWNTIVRANAAGDLGDPIWSAIVEFVEFHSPRREPVVAQTPIRLAPLIEVLSEGGGIRVVRGPYGVGGGPSAPNVPSGIRCGSCGSPYFNGARCVLCGKMSDD